MDQLPRLGKRELICLLTFTCNYVVFVWRGFLFLWVLGMVYVILLWHSLSLPYNYFAIIFQSPSRLTVSNALVRSTKVMYRSTFCSWHFSCSCLAVKIMSIVPLSFLNPH